MIQIEVLEQNINYTVKNNNYGTGISLTNVLLPPIKFKNLIFIERGTKRRQQPDA
jgi:hypothetical protein